MKWVRRIVMILLALGIIGSGILSYLSYDKWKEADKEVTRLSLLKDTQGVSISTSENQESVVFVMCIREADMAGGYGSGYVVGEPGDKAEYIVTNGHVVSYLEQDDSFEVRVYFGKNNYKSAEVIFYQYDKKLDMAILKLSKPTSDRTPVVIRNSDEVNAGDKCVAIGYPDKANDLDTNFSADIASQTVTAGVIGKVNVSPAGKSYKSFQHDAFITHGNSGGPLFDENGFLIGMNTEGREDSENINFSITSNEITKVLKKEKISFTDSEDYADSSDSSSKKADKKKKSELSKMEDQASTEKLKCFIFAGVAALCAVVLIILAIVGNKKVVMVGEQDDGKKSYISCTKGLYAGQKFEFTGHTMTIGRDRNTCTFVFPETTPGISSNHCSVYFDARTKNFVLTDNGSTYGTYLADGRKLTKGVPEQLVPGSVFSLADKTNEFRVERE